MGLCLSLFYLLGGWVEIGIEIWING